MTTSAQFIIAADIGGTHATFALAEVTSEGPRIIAEDSLASRDYQNFAPLLKQFPTAQASNPCAITSPEPVLR